MSGHVGRPGPKRRGLMAGCLCRLGPLADLERLPDLIIHLLTRLANAAMV